MSRKKSPALGRMIRRVVESIWPARRGHAPRSTQRHLRFESLEGRALLAADLGAISGVVSLDGNPVNGAVINLYSDDGDALFEPGAGDALIDTTNSAGAGNYLFDRLAQGDYWVHQPAQTAGAVDLGAAVSPLINISALEAEGVAGTSIDDFADSPVATVTADGVTNPNSIAADHAGALGGERDMIVNLTSGTTAPAVTLASSGNQLVFSSSIDAQGTFNVIYDGNDDDATTLAATGLASVDLTQSGANVALKVRAEADQVGATVRLRIHTDATNYSDSAAVVIPGTSTAEDLIFYFADFSLGAGAAGPADFTDVGAIDLLIETNTNATDGMVTVLGAFGASLETQNFTNDADLSLTKVVDDDTPVVGQDVTYTITVVNSGGAGATNVLVNDDLPAGLTFVSSDPSQGAYDEITGIWDIGTVAVGVDATLEIVATVTGTGVITNNAEVTAADQNDPDSTPNDAAGDDFDTLDITSADGADLSLTKVPSSLTPNLGTNVTFDLTLTNGGTQQATGVVVTDLLPAGLTFQSATASAGTSYDDTTGVWTIGTVNSGANATLSIVARVDSTAAIINNAEVTASAVGDPDSTPGDGQGDDFATATIDAPDAADLSLTKVPSSLTPNLGTDVTFDLTLTNGGPDPATGVVVTDLLPAGLTFQSATASAGTSYDEITGIWTIGNVNSAANATLAIVARVDSTAAIVNNAQVTASGVFDPDSTPNDGAGDDFATATIDAPDAADLSLTKVPSSLTPNFGSNVTFDLTLTNSGPDAATGVSVTDLLPAGLTFQSATASAGTSYNNTTGVWTIGTVNSAANATLAIVARVDSTAAIVNNAQVTASGVFDPDSTPNDGAGDDFATATIDAPAAADLSLTKVPSSTTPNLGTNVTFDLTLTNGGPDQATGVTVTDLLPAGLTFQSATASAGTSYNSTTGVWTIGDVNSGANATLAIVARVDSTAAIVNNAQVTASGVFDPDSTPNDGAGDDFATATIDAPAAADLSLTKVPSSMTPNLGTDVTFNLTLTNGGPDAATGVSVTDLLPAGLTFQSATASAGTTYNSTTGVWTIGTVNSAANATLAIVGRVTTTAAIVNNAQVTASGVFDPDSTPNDGAGDDFATVTIDPPAAADLRLAKTVDVANPDIGENVVFTLTITNDGPDTATNVSVTDILPSGLTFVSSNPSSGAFNSGTGVWTIPAVNSGQSATLTITATKTAPGAISNVAQVTASDQFDVDSTPNNSAAGEDDQATISVNTLPISKRRFLARPLP